ncbi:hypothetical protein BJB45_12240 [Halomonas huangheensis]|uniref:Uncharacterized protein n=1 Tax=Halomonas huangheensis TaxID=1178482 RepID=W1NAJ0_9GAMM|nr:hypothetical protein BJB45_12240 [Halomonas huangheensis]
MLEIIVMRMIILNVWANVCLAFRHSSVSGSQRYIHASMLVPSGLSIGRAD